METKEIPTPFNEMNRKVELATNEYYVLNGWIRFVRDNVYLQIDLEDHPWLANQKRMNFPYYAIINFPANRKDLKDTRVTVRVQAKGVIGAVEGQERIDYMIQLRLLDPTNFSPEQSVR